LEPEDTLERERIEKQLEFKKLQAQLLEEEIHGKK
jgi:hypothetical protein